MKGIYKILILALIIAALLSPFASSSPDGLERVAEDLGFIEKGSQVPIINSPIPDYIFPWINNEGVATALAGVIGTLITFGIMFVIANMIKHKNSKVR